MKNLTLENIARVCGGTYYGPADKLQEEVMSVITDSRKAEEGCLFVPIVGERVDAHKFIPQVMEAGALATLSERVLDNADFPYIAVESSLQAVKDIAEFYLKQLQIPVVGITGSVGKTTTREMISTVLASQKKVFQTIGNQNSQIGVPLTLSHLTREDEIAVLEIGMSERGQIEKLTNMIRPNVAVVTMIGVSHIAQLKTQENICLEKMDIVKGLPEDGMVFLNGDDKFLAPYRGKLSHKTFFYGMDKACDYRAENVHVKDGQTIFHFFYKEGKVIKDMEVVLGTMGEHNVRNALVALGVAHQMGLDMKAAAKALVTFHGQRQQMHTLKSCTLIDDTYNASPDSMKSALKVLEQSGFRAGAGAHRIAVLGDMFELGSESMRQHREVGEFAGKLGIDLLIAVGSDAKYICEGASGGSVKTVFFSSKDELLEKICDLTGYGDIVLVKGSRGMKMEQAVEKLLEYQEL